MRIKYEDKMLELLKSRKAQAAVEIAIIGSLIILAFSYLILFTWKVNIRQELLQQVYRDMLKGAKVDGKSHASPTFFQRGPNILDPYAPGALTPLKISGQIYWHPGKTTGDNPIQAKWDKDEMTEKGTYEKTYERAQTKTWRTVNYGGIERAGP